jgi:hypothetical protein
MEDTPQNKKRKHSYYFVTYQYNHSKYYYYARVRHGVKGITLVVLIGADAAYASDVFNKALGGGEDKINFETVEEFKKAKLLESEAAGIKVVPIDSLMTKIVEHVQKSSTLFRSQQQKAMNSQQQNLQILLLTS